MPTDIEEFRNKCELIAVQWAVVAAKNPTRGS